MKNKLSYAEVMEVYKHPMSVRYIPRIFVSVVLFAITLIATPVLADHLPVMYVQVPQGADDWAVCAVDIPEGFDWENAPWFDANGLGDVAPMQAKTVVEKLQNKGTYEQVVNN